MHDESTKALYDFYPAADKNDFFPAYLYLRYPELFIYYANLALGVTAQEPAEEADEGITQMMKGYIQQFAETVPMAETSTLHGKVMKVQDARKILTQKSALRLHPSEKVVPFKLARDVILENPGAIAVGTCSCRAVQANPCLPPSQQEVCLILGDPFAALIADQNPKFHRGTQEEAVHVIEQAHQRGDVQCAYFKKDSGNRLMEICSCCACCCMAVRVWNMFGGTIPILAPSGYVAHVGDKCDGCGECAGKACPFNAIGLDEQLQKAVIDQAKCMGCGVCEDKCPIHAISLRREPAKGEPLDVDELKTRDHVG
jgi:Pyruvate/2-oxoacid:ferredoxin oxidoreductase delta subunit